MYPLLGRLNEAPFGVLIFAWGRVPSLRLFQVYFLWTLESILSNLIS